MPEPASSNHKKSIAGFSARTILLLVQIALPFGLYFALRWENGLAAGLIAGVYLLSMLYLVWLG
jgi:hypothetical protein